MKYLLNVMDLIIQIDAKYQLLTDRIQAYLIDKADHIDIEINVSEKRLEDGLNDMPYLTIAEVEYMFTSVIFYREIINFNAFVIHSSAVVVDGKAYAFSAKSGVGKSTHTKLYLNHFKNSYIINDDKPAFRLVDNKFKVYGTPWSGKDDISVNAGVDLEALCFIKQGLDNTIRSLNNKEAIPKIIEQTLIPKTKENLTLLLKLLDKFLKLYTVCEMSCDISDNACQTSYEYMKGVHREN
jgi:hypothetical protein